MIAPSDRVAVLWPPLGDRILVTSTLPALAAALRQRGVHADLVGPWDIPWDPQDLASPVHYPRWYRVYAFVRRSITREPDLLKTYQPPPDRLGHPFRGADPPQRVAAVEASWWASLDLSPYDVVVAPGFDVGHRVAHHPTRRPGSRVVLMDFHLLHGVERWKEGERVPPLGDDVTILSCFPSFAALYRAAGLSDRVRWHPYPLHLGHLRPALPASGAIFSGGSHGRAFDTLAEAARRLGPGTPIHVHGHASEVDREGPPLVGLGIAQLPDFVNTIRRSRFVVVPLRHTPRRAAGISVAALALGAGKAVVASDTPAMRDHLRHGVDALLVPPDDPVALADAVRAVHEDEALRQRLEAGARAAGDRLCVEALADTLMGRDVSPWPAAR